MKSLTPALIMMCALCFSMSAASGEVTTSISSNISCYQGEFGSLESYLSRPRTLKAYEDPIQLQRAKERYAWWREAIDCRWITYPVDGLEVRGFIVKPTGTPPESGWPVVIFNHGGNADIGAVRFQYIAARLYPLVHAGFLVIGSQYRGAKIDGEANPDRLRDEFGGRDVNDVLALVSIIDAMPDADGTRIGMFGMSRGGMMSYLAARRSDQFKTMVVQAAPTDLIKGLEDRPEMGKVFSTWIPDFETNAEAALEARSAIYWLDELNPETSILILHGTADRRVNPRDALATASKLQELKRPYKLIMYPNGSHGLREHQRSVNKELVDWFTQHLHENPR